MFLEKPRRTGCQCPLRNAKPDSTNLSSILYFIPFQSVIQYKRKERNRSKKSYLHSKFIGYKSHNRREDGSAYNGHYDKGRCLFCFRSKVFYSQCKNGGKHLSLIHISEPTRLGMISYAVFC